MELKEKTSTASTNDFANNFSFNSKDDFVDSFQVRSRLSGASFSNAKEMIYSIMKIDLREIIFRLKDIPLNSEINCIYVEGNLAWISKNKYGIYRYYTKNNDNTYSLCLLDLMMLNYKCSLSELISCLKKEYSIRIIKEDSLLNETIDCITRNLEIIELSLNNKKERKSLELDDNSLIILDIIYRKWKELKLNKYYVYNAKNFMFSDLQICKEMKSRGIDITRTTINRRVNFLSCLGLLRKDGDNEGGIFYMNKGTTAYTVVDIEACLEKIQNNIQLAKDLKITYSNLSKDIVGFVWSVDLATSIYLNESYNWNKLREMHEELEDIVFSEINKRGYTTKSKIYNSFIARQRRKTPKTEIDFLINYIIVNNKLIYKKPTGLRIEEKGIKSSEYVIRYSKAKKHP